MNSVNHLVICLLSMEPSSRAEGIHGLNAEVEVLEPEGAVLEPEGIGLERDEFGCAPGPCSGKPVLS